MRKLIDIELISSNVCMTVILHECKDMKKTINTKSYLNCACLMLLVGFNNFHKLIQTFFVCLVIRV